MCGAKERKREEKSPGMMRKRGEKAEKRKEIAPARERSGAKKRKKEGKSPRVRKKRGIEKQNE